ncbi:unnamed protein product, partial [Iphiclides podalirius]
MPPFGPNDLYGQKAAGLGNGPGISGRNLQRSSRGPARTRLPRQLADGTLYARRRECRPSAKWLPLTKRADRTASNPGIIRTHLLHSQCRRPIVAHPDTQHAPEEEQRAAEGSGRAVHKAGHNCYDTRGSLGAFENKQPTVG